MEEPRLVVLASLTCGMRVGYGSQVEVCLESAWGRLFSTDWLLEEDCKLVVRFCDNGECAHLYGALPWQHMLKLRSKK